MLQPDGMYEYLYYDTVKVCLRNLAKGSTNFIKTREEIVIRQETIYSAFQVELAVQVYGRQRRC